VRKRISRKGEIWLERYPPSQRDLVMDIEDAKEFNNQMTLVSTSSDDFVGNQDCNTGKMKLLHYQHLDDLLCFEDKEDDLDITLGKELALSNNYKTFLKQRKSLPLRPDSIVFREQV
jgi:hypothetical protein